MQFHSNYCRAPKPAINVKDRTLYARVEPYASLIELVGEDVASASYELAAEGFWQDADTIARAYGYGPAFSEGRSGGWLIVERPPFDTEDPAELKRWTAFEKDIESAVEYARGRYVELMTEYVKATAFERSERAAMAARDIVTVG